MYLVIKHVEAVDFTRTEIIAYSEALDVCTELATKLTIAAEEVELFDNICRISYYVVSGISRITDNADMERIYEEHKEDRG